MKSNRFEGQGEKGKTQLGLSTRRAFIKNTALASLAITSPLCPTSAIAGADRSKKINIFFLSEAANSTRAGRTPVYWAISELQQAIEKRGVESRLHYNLDRLDEEAERVLIAPAQSRMTRHILHQAHATLPQTGESLILQSGTIRQKAVLLVSGSDSRGMVYGILELADRVLYSGDPIGMLRSIGRWTEQPANDIRSMTRLFVSDVEDKSWFYDQSFWRDYLSMLMTQRFNRFSLTLGLGYDAPIKVFDSYFIFSYPYLLDVPGYNVRVRELPNDERDRNLEALRFISDEASKRGLHFQLGLWGHAYECVDSPHVNYPIDGLTDEIHPLYCRKAIGMLLQACPGIAGITFRAHHESGIPFGSKGFWQNVFEAVGECGRRVEIDLHGKGVSFDQVQMALDTGQPVLVSPKLTAEHMGLPAHQAAIRDRERNYRSNVINPRNFFARYGYGDFLSDDREYGILYRIWPGKQKILLWGDPELASGYGRHASFCGSNGLEVCEPLCFKGRQGSGSYPDRRLYADDSLIPEAGNWEKYRYTYRIWGRHLYNPDSKPESYRRYLRQEFGDAAPMLEVGLANSSRVLPLVTSAHLPAGSAMAYWPEMYTNMAIADESLPHPYNDTPVPKLFGWVSPLDPATFSPVNEYVEEQLMQEPSGRYSPAEVANWLEGFCTESEEQISRIQNTGTNFNSPEIRRWLIDIKAQNGLGRFFAEKLRAAIAYKLYLDTEAPAELHAAINFYRKARSAWLSIIEQTQGSYIPNLGFGQLPHRQGHWADRLPAIDQDISYMEKLLKGKTEDVPVSESHGLSKTLTKLLQSRPPLPECHHDHPRWFIPGNALDITLTSEKQTVDRVVLKYRHVNQAEAYQTLDMKKEQGLWRASIPAAYTDSPYPLLYFFVLHGQEQDRGSKIYHAWMYPGFQKSLANQPYFVVQRKGARHRVRL